MRKALPMAAIALWLMLLHSPPRGAALGAASQTREVGTVDTIAGPGFCQWRAIMDGSSLTVRSLVVDSQGQIYVDTGPAEKGDIGKVDVAGRATLLAVGGPPADEPKTAGAGSSVAASAPGRLASDGAGGVLVASGNHVLQLYQQGGVASIAGNPVAPPTTGGDAGPSVEARFNRIMAITSDRDGNVFVADELTTRRGSARIRFINRSRDATTFYAGTPEELTIQPGHIDTIAGTEKADPGTRRARATTIDNGPRAMAIRDGLLYLSAYTRARGDLPATSEVRVINLSGDLASAHGVEIEAGAVAVIAGGARLGFGGDGGPAVSAAFSRISGLDLDAEASLFLADEDNHRVRKVDRAGTVTTFAGSGGTGRNGGGFNGNGRPARGAQLDRPYDVKVHPDGDVYISDHRNGQVRMVDRTGTIRPARGNGVGRSWTCVTERDDDSAPIDIPARGEPASVATDAEGKVYLATKLLPEVRSIGRSGAVTTLAAEREDPESQSALAVGPTVPAALDVHDGGALYVLDSNRRLRLWNLLNGPLQADGAALGPGESRVLMRSVGESGPTPHSSVAADGNNVFVADGAAVVRLEAGGDEEPVPGIDPNGVGVCCETPAGLELDRTGNLYVSDSSDFVRSPRVWFINRGDKPVQAHGQTILPGEIRPVAGSGTRGFGGDDGPALEAQLLQPAGLAVDTKGTLYIADRLDSSVRSVDAKGTISTVVGGGTGVGFNGDWLNGRLTALESPTDVALDACGNLLIADTGNDRVRRLNLVARCELDAPVAPEAARPISGRAIFIAALSGATIGGFGLVMWRRLRRR